MATKRAIISNEDHVTTLAKEAVTAGREWSAAVREATLIPMLKMFAWHQPTSSIVEPWVEMTRQTHDRLLECWETQSHHFIDESMRMMATTTERIVGQVKGADGGDGVRRAIETTSTTAS